MCYISCLCTWCSSSNCNGYNNNSCCQTEVQHKILQAQRSLHIWSGRMRSQWKQSILTHSHTHTVTQLKELKTVWQLCIRIFAVAAATVPQIRWPLQIWDMRTLHAWLSCCRVGAAAAAVAATCSNLRHATASRCYCCCCCHTPATSSCIAQSVAHTHTHMERQRCRCYVAVANLNSAVWRRQFRLQFGLQRDTARLHNSSATQLDSQLDSYLSQYIPIPRSWIRDWLPIILVAPNRKWYALIASRELLLIIHSKNRKYTKTNNYNNSNQNNNSHDSG